MLVAAGLASSAPAGAQDPDVPIVGESVAGYDTLDWLGLGLRLALVIAVIWGAVWAMRWYVRRVNGDPTGSGRLLHVIESRALGPNRSLQLVRLGRRAVLVGVTPERINALLTLDDPDEVDDLTRSMAQPTAAPGVIEAAVARFSGSIARFGGRAAPSARGQVPPADAPLTSPDASVSRVWPEYASPPPAEDQDVTPASAQRLQATGTYRRASVAELQRAIEQARGQRPPGMQR